MTALTPAEIERGLAENASAPHGAARIAHAEALSAAAESSGDRTLFRHALSALIDAYEYSAERTKMTVPFARLLQEYDRDPSVFAAHETHGLYWRFKWVTGSIVGSPEVPLDAIERWLAEMERRYRVAGFSERAVRQAEFYLADSLGDRARADRAMSDWAAAERDRMSDCHACELSNQGRYWARREEDTKAIGVWEPVLAGQKTCMEEPHRALAHSLLSLVRLGHTDEARSHHLRGYRMARGNESLLRAIGEHIEFCALTGNESRGLEILSEHTAHLGPLADAEAQLGFNGGVLVLLRRLTDLGHGDRPAVPYEGVGRTVRELADLLYGQVSAIAERFDARNGSGHVSGLLAERLARRPLTDALPLGVRSPVLPGAGTGAVSGRAGAVAGGGGALTGDSVPSGAAGTVRADGAGGAEELADLVERARAFRKRGIRALPFCGTASPTWSTPPAWSPTLSSPPTCWSVAPCTRRGPVTRAPARCSRRPWTRTGRADSRGGRFSPSCTRRPRRSSSGPERARRATCSPRPPRPRVRWRSPTSRGRAVSPPSSSPASGSRPTSAPRRPGCSGTASTATRTVRTPNCRAS